MPKQSFQIKQIEPKKPFIAPWRARLMHPVKEQIYVVKVLH